METSRPIRVFLIDDQPITLWGLQKLIESSRSAMEVVGSASTLADAIALLANTETDVIVLEIGLGAGSIDDAMAQLIDGSPARILVLTALRDSSLHDKAVLAGARGVVEKLAPIEVILTAIEKVHAGQLWLDRAATGRIFVEFSRQGASRNLDPERQKISDLTAREREIVAAAANHAGATAKVIADRLHISEHTLRNHLTTIYDKLGVINRLELYAYAQRHGLDKPPT